MGLLDTEVAKWKRAFGLLGGIPKTFKNNPRNAETMDAVFGLGGLLPGIGDVSSAIESKYRFGQGDTLGGLLAGAGVLPLIPNVAGMFIGKGAKTWDAVKASQAIKMEAKGIDPRTIWKETGNWKAPDGKWRQEIPDNEITLKNTPIAKDWETFFKEKEINKYGMRGAQVSEMKGDSFSAFKKFRADAEKEFNDHNKTHRNINEILHHEALINSYPELEKTSVMWNPNIGKSGEYSRGTISFGDATNESGLKSLFGHELQHAIQQREGFARGGSPEAMRSFLAPDPSLQSAYSQAELNDAYRRLAGEAEARLTQARMPMTMDERLATPPWTMFDVPEAQQIVRFGDGPAMNAPMRPSNASVGMSSKPKGWVSGWETRIDQPYLEGPPAPKRPLDTWGGYGTPEEYQAAQAAKQIADAEWAARTSQAQRNIRYGASRSPYAGGQSDKVYDRIAQDVPPYLNDRPRNHLGQEIPPTPYELAHAEAQRVAALPVEQGGLGLPLGNTAMDRAMAMGVDTNLWHGQRANEPVREYF